MERSMGSLPGEGTKTCWKVYWKCFWWGVDCIFLHFEATYLASIKEGVMCANIYVFHHQVCLGALCPAKSLNNHVGFCMMGVLKFLLYLACLLGKKEVISSCFIRGPGCFFSQLSLVFLLSCSFYNYWVVQCSKMPYQRSTADRYVRLIQTASKCYCPPPFFVAAWVYLKQPFSGKQIQYPVLYLALTLSTLIAEMLN